MTDIAKAVAWLALFGFLVLFAGTLLAGVAGRARSSL